MAYHDLPPGAAKHETSSSLKGEFSGLANRKKFRYNRQMPRIDLNVPYAEKDLAKALGALWDQSKRVWFVPDGADPIPFGRWLPRTAAELEQALLMFISIVEHSYDKMFAEIDDLNARLAALERDYSTPFQRRLRKHAGHLRVKKMTRTV